MKRRIAVGIATLAALLAILALGAFFVVRQRALARLGCSGDVGVPTIWPGTVTLRSVDLVCRRGTIRLDSLVLRGSLLELAGGHVTSVAARGGAISVIMPGQSTHVAAAARRVLPSWSADNVEIEVRGTSEILGHAHLVHGAGSDSDLSLDVADLVTSEVRSPSVSARHIHAILLRSDRWRVSTLNVDVLSVTLSDSPPLRDAFAAARSAAPEGPRQTLLDRFTSDAEVEVRDASIVDGEGVSVSALTIHAARHGSDTVRFSGEGSPRGTGHMRWNVSVQPSSLDADGTVDLERVPWSVFEAFLPELPLQHTENTLLSGSLELHSADHRVDFSGTVAVAAMTVMHARLAADPVLVEGSATGSGHWDRATHELVVDRGAITVGRAHVNVAGRVMRDGERYLANLDVSLPATSCQSAVASIPRGLLQETAGWTLEGSLSASAHLEVNSEHLDDTVLGLRVNDGCTFVGVPAMADINRFRGPFRHVVTEPDHSIFEMETGPGTAEWTSIHEVSPFLVHSVVAHEDAAFFRHSGFAPWAIRDALVRNLRERRYVLGASTITMQLVKNVFLRREKTLARKVQEVLLTWWLERSMSKEQILELYLNVIEYGPQVYGVRHAASHYFGRTPAELTPAESAYLAMILPNPPAFHEQYESGAVPPAFARRVQRFVDTLRERGRIDEDARALAVEELADMRFSRAGERVGPELRGSSASLPIEGFSGMPLVEWSDESVVQDGEPDTDTSANDDWEESWP